MDIPAFHVLDGIGGSLFFQQSHLLEDLEHEYRDVIHEINLLEDRTEMQQVAAAAYAADILRSATRDMDDELRAPMEDCMAALEALRRLEPRLSVVHHEAVAALLPSRDNDLAGLSAYTLGCLGPEAVAEHFEELVAMGEPRPGMQWRLGYGKPQGGSRWEEGVIATAVWVALSVLEPEHLFRLEARGACSLLELADRIPDSTMLGLLAPALINDMLGAQASFRALESPRLSLTALRSIVVDPLSMLSTFVPVSLPPWAPAAHRTYPAPARARAVELLLMGYLLARRTGLFGEGNVEDLWIGSVMPAALERRSYPGGLAALRSRDAFAVKWDARVAAEAAAAAREEAAREAKLQKSREKADRKRKWAAGEGPSSSSNPAACSKCGLGSFAKACKHKCCGGCCPGPCPRHKK